MAEATKDVRKLFIERFIKFWDDNERSETLAKENNEKTQARSMFACKTKETLMPWVEKMKIEELIKGQGCVEKETHKIKISQIRF